MADKEKVLFSRGSSSTIPTTKVPGTFLIATDTGEMYLDDSSTLRIQIKDTTKMSISNPTGTGSFSLNRKADTAVGPNSFVSGNNTASGNSSHAEGADTTASGSNSHAEGYGTTASGARSHSEGFGTTALGDSSHSEGFGTTAYSDRQHVQGKFNIVDSNGVYADIIGNGADVNHRSNAATVDWSGNAWYAGDVYVGSTSGTNRDEGSKKLATEESVSSATSGAVIDDGYIG